MAKRPNPSMKRAVTKRAVSHATLLTSCKSKLAMREFKDALKIADQCLKGQSSLIPDQSAQLHYFAGEALLGIGNIKEAKKRFEKAISANPEDQLPYLSLSRCYAREGNHKVVHQTLKNGLAACQETTELRMLEIAFQKRPSISACLIVKNEEELLPECLESIRDWVDEIIVVDTGSTDKTVEIAESYGARVFHHAWEGDFSKARNYSLHYATKDWILIIDADERIQADQAPLILKTLTDSPHHIVSINVFNTYERNKNLTVFLPSVRFFKRELGLTYGGIVHNQLNIPPDQSVLRTGVKLFHLGYGLSTEKMAKKQVRSKALLEKQLEKNPNDPFALFNYAQLLRSNGEGFAPEHVLTVISSASRAVDLTSPDDSATRHIHLMCLDQLAWAHFFEKKYGTAIAFCHRALEIKSDYLDPMLLLGHIHAQQLDISSALQAYQRYLNARDRYDPSRETDNIILLHLNSQAIAHYSMAMISEIAGDTNSATEFFRRTLALDPEYMDANEKLGILLLANGSLDEAEEHFQKQLNINRTSTRSVIGLSEIYESRGEIDRAVEELEKVVALSQGSSALLISLGRLNLLSGRDREADTLFEGAAGSDNNSAETRKLIADTYQQCGRADRAAVIYEQLLVGQGDSGDLLNDLGNCFFKQGKFTQAETYYRKALELEPSHAPSLRNLGLTLARLNQLDEAAGLLDSYVTENPEPAVVDILAGIFMSIGEPERSVSIYEQRLQVDPTDMGALYHLSECYLAMGHRDAALAGLRSVVKSAPDFAPAIERIRQLEGRQRSPVPVG